MFIVFRILDVIRPFKHAIAVIREAFFPEAPCFVCVHLCGWMLIISEKLCLFIYLFILCCGSCIYLLLTIF